MASKKASVEVVTLKAKVKELESQVTDYKKRLDDLRKAKNTTILRREREVVEVAAPHLGRRASGKAVTASGEENSVEQLKLKHQKELDEMQKRHDEEIKNLTKNQCSHDDEEIRRLKAQVVDLGADNAALVVENGDLKERVASLLHELSIKEAKWCETEEELKMKIKLDWGVKYRDWMESTEKKIEELQQANEFLRKMVKKPDGTPRYK